MDDIRTDALAESGAASLLELVPRNCRLTGDYENQHVDPVVVTGKLTAFASPDSTWEVTSRVLSAAQRSILIGIYDFTAQHVKELLLKKLVEGIKVELMLDLDHIGAEDEIFAELVDAGCRGVSSPSCPNVKPAARVFPSCHEKVIVVDDRWVFVQSGNYSDRSIPPNVWKNGTVVKFHAGNRDMGVLVDSSELAAFFRRILIADMKRSTSAPADESPASARAGLDLMLEAKPPAVPKLVAAQNFDVEALEITPILSPDNYMEVIVPFLESATRSIEIEQQYIRGSQDDIQTLLDAIDRARKKHPDLTIRIVLAVPMSAKDAQKERKNLELLQEEWSLKLGTHIRFLDPKRFTHCHNKLIVVDEERVLVSSQNWSGAAVRQNREAGLLIPHAGVAAYFRSIFDFDWATGARDIPVKGGGTEEGPAPEMLTVSPGDYADV